MFSLLLKLLLSRFLLKFSPHFFHNLFFELKEVLFCDFRMSHRWRFLLRGSSSLVLSLLNHRLGSIRGGLRWFWHNLYLGRLKLGNLGCSRRNRSHIIKWLIQHELWRLCFKRLKMLRFMVRYFGRSRSLEIMRSHLVGMRLRTGLIHDRSGAEIIKGFPTAKIILVEFRCPELLSLELSISLIALYF